MKNMIKTLTLTLLLVVIPAGMASALTPMKNGDKVMLKCDSGYLSWYKGNWVVIAKEFQGAGSTWIVANLQGNHFQLINARTKTPLDGDFDNSVVLDDNDHPNWFVSKRAQLNEPGDKLDNCVAILNVDFKGEYALYNKGNEVQDVVLRNTKATGFYFIRVK